MGNNIEKALESIARGLLAFSTGSLWALGIGGTIAGFMGRHPEGTFAIVLAVAMHKVIKFWLGVLND